MNKENKNNNDYQSNAQLGMLTILGIGALLWKNEDKIRLWFYQNTIPLVLGGIALLALLGMYLWYKFKKKEEEYFKKRRQLKGIQPQARDINYYQRKESNGRDLNR